MGTSGSRYGSTSNYSSTTSSSYWYPQNTSSGYGSGSSSQMSMSKNSTGSSSYSNSSYNRSSYGGGTSSQTGAYFPSGHQGASPWQSGMNPLAAGTGMGGEKRKAGLLPSPRANNSAIIQGGGRQGSYDIAGAIGQLQQMESPQSKVALNLLDAVLAANSKKSQREEPSWSGYPPNKMRRMDPLVRDGGHGNRRGWTRDHQYQTPRVWNPEDSQLARASQSYGSPGHQTMGLPFRKVAKAKRGKPKPDTRNKGPGNYQQKKKSEAASTAAANTPNSQKGKVSEDDSSATAGPIQSSVAESPSSDADKGKFSMQNSEQKQDIPKEALKCHMCDLNKFKSIWGFLRHLQSKEHYWSADSFHLHGLNTLSLLRLDAKLTSQRQMTALYMKNKKEEDLSFCPKCECRVVGSMDEHQKTVEHKLVNDYMKGKCCGRFFNKKGAFEEHRVTLQHLKTQHSMKEKQQLLKSFVDEEGTEDVPEEQAMQMFKDATLKCKDEANEEEEITSSTLPPYNPKEAVGVHLLGTRSHYKCLVCPESKLMEAVENVNKHFRSMSHYLNLLAYVNEKQKEKLKAKKLKKEVAKDAEKEDTEDTVRDEDGQKEEIGDKEHGNEEKKETIDTVEADSTQNEEIEDVEAADTLKDETNTIEHGNEEKRETKEVVEVENTLENEREDVGAADTLKEITNTTENGKEETRDIVEVENALKEEMKDVGTEEKQNVEAEGTQNSEDTKAVRSEIGDKMEASEMSDTVNTTTEEGAMVITDQEVDEDAGVVKQEEKANILQKDKEDHLESEELLKHEGEKSELGTTVMNGEAEENEHAEGTQWENEGASQQECDVVMQEAVADVDDSDKEEDIQSSIE
ncbi:hypothetical protein Pcinc_037906 [Petrolisthes cinctipes]|uniref:Uncharacterized protein n=1 Tax=Petrolisthes cinctipes TaxID=88211 RepID=A0AAE1BS27_PETCI|nr:hypothetical protein Pcinc_037906 [Petrolisthes cinctipes]